MEQKKNSNFIIPATFFTALSPTKTTKPNKTTHKLSTKKEISEPNTIKNSEKNQIPKLTNIKRRPSALSLSSVHKKPEEQETFESQENYDNHPKTPFSEKQLKDVWNNYHQKLIKIGEKNIASILISNTPLVKSNFIVEYTLPNTLMKSQLEKEKPKLLAFLREQLNNYGITIVINVNESIEKEFVYHTSDKFKKMVEKNPLLEKLKNTFGLEI